MQRRLGGLDGLRAVAIAGVVACHASRLVALEGHRTWGLGLLRGWGPGAVSLLFALSGFLITMLLLEDEARHGTVQLGRFFRRRVFRIFPPYWAFLAGMAVLAALGFFPQPEGALRRAFFLQSDYVNLHSWSLGHTWSLAVEGQFYLVWPLVLKWLGKERSRKVAFALLLVTPLVRVVAYALFPARLSEMANMFHTRLDCLMVGCVAALLMRTRPESRLLVWARKGKTAAAAGVVLVLVQPVGYHLFGYPYLLIGFSIEAVSSAVLLLWAIEPGTDWAKRLLNAPPVMKVAMLGYGAYLWQEPMLDPGFHLSLAWLPARIVMAYFLAWVSYRAIEIPSLAIRARLNGGSAEAGAPAVASAGRADSSSVR